MLGKQWELYEQKIQNVLDVFLLNRIRPLSWQGLILLTFKA